MKKALVFLADGCEMCEALCVVDVLRRAGIKVVTAGVTGERVVSSHDVDIYVDVLLSEVKEDDCDLVFCPVCMSGATNLASSSLVNSLILSTYNKGRVVSAICASPAVVFGPLGIIKSGKATCYPGCEEFAPRIDFVSDGVVVDGNVVTGKSAGWAFDLGLKLISLLLGDDKAEKVRASIYYKD